MRECQEATLSEILADPIVLMVMAADGVDPHEFESNLRKADHSRRRAGEDRNRPTARVDGRARAKR